MHFINGAQYPGVELYQVLVRLESLTDSDPNASCMGGAGHFNLNLYCHSRLVLFNPWNLKVAECVGVRSPFRRKYTIVHHTFKPYSGVA